MLPAHRWSWLAHRQGLLSRLPSAGEALIRSGWCRSVGSANPYLAIHARTGLSRAEIDASLAGQEIQELGAARGCTYVLPSSEVLIGVAVGRSTGGQGLQTAIRFLGVTDEEVSGLAEAISDLLGSEPKDPATLKKELGSEVRDLGAEGRKRGQTNTLSLGIARLAEQARTRRVPLNGRLDTERYGYVSWSPPAPIPSAEEAYAGLAERYFAWTGSATLAEFKEFCGCTLKEAQFATRELGLVADPSASKHLMLPHLLEEREQFTPLEAPSIVFVGNMDSIGLHRRNLGELLDDDDRAAAVRLTEAQGSRNLLGESDSHLILDRGRWIGVWDFDTLRNKLIWVTWQTPTDEVREAAGACERFVRDELGDARTSSQDSPQSRSKRIAAIEMLNQ